MRILPHRLKRQIHFWFIRLLMVLVLGQRTSAESAFIADSWDAVDGMPQSSCTSVIQTRDGYLWLGTLNGLVRFDGNSMTPFDVNNTPGLPGNGIIFLFEDSRTNLWAGTDNGGLCLIKNGVAQRIETDGVGKIVSVFEDDAGTLWFMTESLRFIRCQQEKLERSPYMFPTQAAFADAYFRAVHLILPSRDGGSWKLQSGRVEKWRGGRLEKNFGPVRWTNVIVTAAIEDHEGNLVVGTRGSGVYWFDAAGGYRQAYSADPKNQAHNYVLSLCCDREGNLWVGTDGSGLDRVKRKIFSAPDELSEGVALSAAEDGQGGLWSAFNLRGLTHWQTNSVRHFNIGLESKPGPVLVDTQHNVWAGSSGEGLFQLGADGFIKPVRRVEKAGEKIYALFQSRDGKVWAGGTSGLSCFDGQLWQSYPATEGLSLSTIRALAEDAAGNLWIGTEGAGLYSLRDGKISPANAPVKDISCLFVARDGVLWAGTKAHGLARLQAGNWTQFTKNDGLINDINYLIEDDLDNLWIGSYEGLLRVEKKSLAGFAADPTRKISCRTFLTRECSAGAQPAALRTRDGKLWFPTTEGFVSVNPAELKSNPNPPPVVIESVLVDGVQQKNNPLSSIWPEAVTLSPDTEQLEIHFTALNFSAPKRARLAVQFRYQLEGYEKKPTDVGDVRAAHFPKLPPGKYVFHVKACNEDGVWNEAGATLAITVEPPFWRKAWFIAMVSLCVLGTLAGIIYLISTAKLKRQLRAAQQKELIEHERARIARDLHDQLGANLTQVTLLGEMAEMDKNQPGEVEQHAQQICETARETTRSLDEIVWAVNPSNDTLEGLVNYACKYAQDYLALAGISYRADLPPQLLPTPIPPEVRHNIFLAFKEAVNNVVKHAQATEARVALELEPGYFILSIADNGRGLGDLSGKQLRNGMKNMRRRLADVRGEFAIAPRASGGTVVQLKVPITAPKP